MNATSSPPKHRNRALLWRIAGWVLLTIILAASFAGYLGIDMQMQWENLAALCGF